MSRTDFKKGLCSPSLSFPLFTEYILKFTFLLNLSTLSVAAASNLVEVCGSAYLSISKFGVRVVVGRIWFIWPIGGVFHTGLVVDDIHGIHYLQKAPQRQYTSSQIFLKTYLMKTSHCSWWVIKFLRPENRRNYRWWSFLIVLLNSQFNVINRRRFQIHNRNKHSRFIQHTHRIFLLIVIRLLKCLLLPIICGYIYSNRHNWQVLVLRRHCNRHANSQNPNLDKIKIPDTKLNIQGCVFKATNHNEHIFINCIFIHYEDKTQRNTSSTTYMCPNQLRGNSPIKMFLG